MPTVALNELLNKQGGEFIWRVLKRESILAIRIDIIERRKRI